MRYNPGDIGLERAANRDGSPPSAVSQLIMAGERSRRSRNATWSHSFIIVSEAGDIIEANESGVELRNIREYESRDVVIINTHATPEQRALAVMFAHGELGAEYGILDFVSLGFQAVFGWDLSFTKNRQQICSQLVSRATEKYIPAYPYPPQDMMPSDLADYWHVSDPDPAPPLGWFGRFLNLLLLPRELLRAHK